MTITIRFKHLLLAISLLIIGALIGQAFSGVNVYAAPQTAKQSESQTQTLNAPVDLKGFECQVATVGVDPNRIVTHCLPLDGAIGWYSLPTNNDPKHAARVLAVLLTAKSTNKLVSLAYDTQDTTTCPDPNNCRRLWSVETK